MKPNKPKAPAKADMNAGVMRDDDARKWKVRDGLDTLQRAEEIRRDPELMREIDECRTQKIRDLQAVKVKVAPITIKGMK